MADKNFLTEIIDADLAEGKVSEIHTRFPPEPNGYLHIGSAKAIYINWSIANQYGGKFNLRLDDTNPAREGEEYVNSIIEDLHWLGADPNGGIFYGSDYFDKCYEYAEKLILEGKAYVDDLTRDEMREYRGSDAGKPSRPSPWRDRTPEENLDLFRRMRAGEFKEGEKTLRAKIDYGTAVASTTMGACGVKVWIYLGEKLPGQPVPNPALEGSSRPRRRNSERRGQ